MPSGWRKKLREEHGIAIKYSTLTRHLRQLGIGAPVSLRCERVPDQPGAEMQHDTSPFTLRVGAVLLRLQASPALPAPLQRRYLQFYPVFDRFHLKCFLHLGLIHWGYAPRICVIDNTNLARLRGLGSNAVIVPEMEAFAKAYGFVFLCHAPGHPDRKAGEERSFLTVETNFVPGRTFQTLEDLNRQALEWSTVRLEQRPQGKAGLIPAQAFEHERAFLTQLPKHLPAPYLLLERSIDEYGYVAVEGNYYEAPGAGRGKIQVLRHLHHLVLCQDRRRLIEYPLPPWGVSNQPFGLPGEKSAALSASQSQTVQPGGGKTPAGHRPLDQRLRGLHPRRSGPVASPVPAPTLGVAAALEHDVVPARHRAGSPLPDHQPGDPRTHRSLAAGRHRAARSPGRSRTGKTSRLSGRLPHRHPRPLPL